ncbi:hypothetical protein F511_11224 [Dorcoceras hygrometricum]|uniref:Secreted protein n=1 Tax=Dorcoceras hygrometricum TaxID=472368 RepID=A0A2Z7C9R7_9LAMI|nr:hypothetical protein F511_11224 [Dorcoceras hygrometricum]
MKLLVFEAFWRSLFRVLSCWFKLRDVQEQRAIAAQVCIGSVQLSLCTNTRMMRSDVVLNKLKRCVLIIATG